MNNKKGKPAAMEFFVEERNGMVVRQRQPRCITHQRKGYWRSHHKREERREDKTFNSQRELWGRSTKPNKPHPTINLPFLQKEKNWFVWVCFGCCCAIVELELLVEFVDVRSCGGAIGGATAHNRAAIHSINLNQLIQLNRPPSNEKQSFSITAGAGQPAGVSFMNLSIHSLNSYFYNKWNSRISLNLFFL